LLLLLSLSAATAAPRPSADVATAPAPVSIDGVLDEPAWAAAAPVTEFLKFQPAVGGAAPGVTDVRFLQDERHLYVGIRVDDADYDIRARVSPREQINADDQIGLYLDTFGDERTGYIFYFNPLGVQQDIRFSNGSWSANWNTVMRTRGQVDADGRGYTLEIAIPFRSLRYPDDEGPQDWGVLISRKIPSEGAKYSWPVRERGHPRVFSQAAALRGVEPAPAGAGLELIPVLALRQDAARPEADQPLDWSGLDPWYEAVRPGLDVRLGLGPDTGLAATVNPDFSQIEGDQPQIDLNQRFAFYFPEQRPFFLDGNDAFEDQLSTLYTRSIVEPIYGVKLSSHEGPFTMGALQSIDRSPAASVHQDGTPGFSEDELADAWTMNAFGRLRVDAFDGGYVGASVADKRDLDRGGAFSDVASIDVDAPLGERLTARAAAAGSVAGDGDGDALAGHAGHLILERAGGVGWGWNVAAADTGPGYRNEMGFVTQSGRSDARGTANYTFEPEGAVDAVSPGGWLFGQVERDGDYLAGCGVSTNMIVGGVHRPSISAGLSDQVEGGVRQPGWEGTLSFSSDLSRVLNVSAYAGLRRVIDYELLLPALSTVAGASTTLRPTTRLRVDLSADQQWFTAESEPTETATALWGRGTLQFTRALGARVIGQTTLGSEVDEPAVNSSYLLTWLRNPGTEFYLGATQLFALGASPSGGPQLTDQVLFAKASWLFRL